MRYFKSIILAEHDQHGWGQVILASTRLNLDANVRPVKLFQGVKHKVHGIHKDIWDPNRNMVMVRENTEGLYHSLLRRIPQKAIGEKDDPMVTVLAD